jgi:hypothetical protein
MSIGPVADATNVDEAEQLKTANPMPDAGYQEPTQIPTDLGVIR